VRLAVVVIPLEEVILSARLTVLMKCLCILGRGGQEKPSGDDVVEKY
jgi:hypothetical protein